MYIQCVGIENCEKVLRDTIANASQQNTPLTFPLKIPHDENRSVLKQF